jgi:hypothetical protein
MSHLKSAVICYLSIVFSTFLCAAEPTNESSCCSDYARWPARRRGFFGGADKRLIVKENGVENVEENHVAFLSRSAQRNDVRH